MSAEKEFKEKAWIWICLYVVYIILIVGMAFYHGTKKPHPRTYDQMPIIEQTVPAEKTITVKYQKKAVVKALEVVSLPTPIVEEINYTPVEPVVADIAICEQTLAIQDKLIVALTKELVTTKAKLKECESRSSKLSAPSDKELELMLTNAIEHNRYVGQKMWEKLEADCGKN